jgi:transcriptional regulator with XRE-family HTH domain
LCDFPDVGQKAREAPASDAGAGTGALRSRGPFGELDPKHFQAIEYGRSNVTVASLVGVARALGVTLTELFKGV